MLWEELKQIVDRRAAHPETARDELSGIWNMMVDRAPFVLEVGTSGRKKGHRRPALLSPPPKKAKPPNLGQVFPSSVGSASASSS